MKRQIAFAQAESGCKKRLTKRQRLLAEMEKVVMRSRLLSSLSHTTRRATEANPCHCCKNLIRSISRPYTTDVWDREWSFDAPYLTLTN